MAGYLYGTCYMSYIMCKSRLLKYIQRLKKWKPSRDYSLISFIRRINKSFADTLFVKFIFSN